MNKVPTKKQTKANEKKKWVAPKIEAITLKSGGQNNDHEGDTYYPYCSYC